MEKDLTVQSERFEALPDILTARQVRDILGIGRASVYHLLDARIIPCFKIGRVYKIPKSSLISYIENSCKEEGNF